jgi:hypothetical protein
MTRPPNALRATGALFVTLFELSTSLVSAPKLLYTHGF